MGRCDDVTAADFIREFGLAAQKSVQPEKQLADIGVTAAKVSFVRSL
jgi:hypothetical protein